MTYFTLEGINMLFLMPYTFLQGWNRQCINNGDGYDLHKAQSYQIFQRWDEFTLSIAIAYLLWK
jgi:hypothetical protein